MSTKADTLRNILDINVQGALNRVGSTSIRVWKSFEFELSPASVKTSSASGASLRQTALYENHPLAPVSGLLENHPLRDEYLDALGITE
jgi:hypothetical protein